MNTKWRRLVFVLALALALLALLRGVSRAGSATPDTSLNPRLDQASEPSDGLGR
jgi:hypothetical protein